MRRTASLLFAAVMVVGCGGIGGPNFTIPPIVIPSLPPFDIPSGLLPSVNPGSGVCTLATAAEVGTIFGSTPQITSSEATECTFTFPNFSAVVISTASGSDLQTSKFLFGDTAKDIVVGGLPAVSGVFIGQPAVHVQKGANQLQVLGVLTGSDDATIAKLVQLATLAVGRWPG